MAAEAAGAPALKKPPPMPALRPAVSGETPKEFLDGAKNVALDAFKEVQKLAAMDPAAMLCQGELCKQKQAAKEVQYGTGPPVNMTLAQKQTLKYAQCVLVTGFEASCIENDPRKKRCMAGSVDMQPQTFDGIWRFVGTGENYGREGDLFPVYKKDVYFKSFQHIKALFLSRTVRPPREGIAPTQFDQGTWAAINANRLDFRYTGAGQKSPFAFTASAAPPGTCSDSDPASFPMCTTGSTLWYLARATENCNGISRGNMCAFNMRLSIRDIKCPSAWEKQLQQRGIDPDTNPGVAFLERHNNPKYATSGAKARRLDQHAGDADL
ncbi:unnamed protein product [Vitrella brassicaformis CCMP3155]|uniref:Uncharacterized protein n=1 Tax=Vitrella brassicaformis (strain CCMP3155) TaxID=1169540 RepID=A0A0G4EVN0_VITBC|nr:unnamed protein product [Vitrella brassicaformis CCMP3155]|eukprot:CEM02477.1 unnamed protein product [Vitrella brassicaformis CCMP3155]